MNPTAKNLTPLPFKRQVQVRDDGMFFMCSLEMTKGIIKDKRFRPTLDETPSERKRIPLTKQQKEGGTLRTKLYRDMGRYAVKISRGNVYYVPAESIGQVRIAIATARDEVAAWNEHALSTGNPYKMVLTELVTMASRKEIETLVKRCVYEHAVILYDLFRLGRHENIQKRIVMMKDIPHMFEAGDRDGLGDMLRRVEGDCRRMGESRDHEAFGKTVNLDHIVYIENLFGDDNANV